MSQNSKKEGTKADGGGEQFIKTVRQKTRKRYSAEEKIRIVMEGLRGDISVSELCRREGVHSNVYYKWLKDFMEAGKARLKGDTVRNASKEEVGELKRENKRLKELVADYAIEIHALKKSLK